MSEENPLKKEWCTVAEAQEILGVSRSRVHQIARERGWETLTIEGQLTVLRRRDVKSHRPKKPGRKPLAETPK